MLCYMQVALFTPFMQPPLSTAPSTFIIMPDQLGASSASSFLHLAWELLSLRPIMAMLLLRVWERLRRSLANSSGRQSSMCFCVR